MGSCLRRSLQFGREALQVGHLFYQSFPRIAILVVVDDSDRTIIFAFQDHPEHFRLGVTFTDTVKVFSLGCTNARDIDGHQMGFDPWKELRETLMMLDGMVKIIHDADV